MVSTGISPEYFLDRMSLDEVEALLNADDNNKKVGWEQTRTLCFYSLISYNGTKVFKKPKDIFPLPWDNEKKKEVIVDKAKVEKKLKKAEKFLNNAK